MATQNAIQTQNDFIGVIRRTISNALDYMFPVIRAEMYRRQLFKEIRESREDVMRNRAEIADMKEAAELLLYDVRHEIATRERFIIADLDRISANMEADYE